MKIVLLILSIGGLTRAELSPVCDSDIYCHGPLLHTVQMASIFADSKTFVDMKMKKNSKETMISFNNMMNITKNDPSQNDVKRFLNDAFEPAGSEFENWEPSDWKESPAFLDTINDRLLKSWASDLNQLWKQLGRKMKTDVKENEDLYSIIYVPHPVIVPGGRFREFYYWDSYWIIKGLLESEMFTTVKGMLENYVIIVNKIGFIPNGGRIYYTMRSQPPLFIPMVDSYLEVTKDLDFLRKNIDTLEKEFLFWMTNHTVKVEKEGVMYTLARYNDESFGPRPESYREDIMAAEVFKSDTEKNDFYSELKSAAESGWDFSSRWFIANGTNKGTIKNTKTKSILPVDLNAIIYWNAHLLSKFYGKLNNTAKKESYEKLADEWMEAVTKVLWHDELGIWLDYDLLNGMKRDYFYPSNLAPLWTNCYEQKQRNDYAQKVMEYLKKTKIYESAGGLPTTLYHSGEQWDYPNAWPPLQYMVIMGLDMTGNVLAKEMAYGMAERWVRSNFIAFNETNAMYEKYDATLVGSYGGGGEYEVQLGFGWTNGIILEFLRKYGSTLKVAREENTVNYSNAGSVYTSHIGPLVTIILAQTTLAAGCVGAILYARRFSPHPDKSLYQRLAGTPTL